MVHLSNTMNMCVRVCVVCYNTYVQFVHFTCMHCVFAVGFSGPYPILIKKRPLGTLAGPNVLLSLMVHLLLITGTQLALWYYLKTRQWLVVMYVICSYSFNKGVIYITIFLESRLCASLIKMAVYGV